MRSVGISTYARLDSWLTVNEPDLDDDVLTLRIYILVLHRPITDKIDETDGQFVTQNQRAKRKSDIGF